VPLGRLVTLFRKAVVWRFNAEEEGVAKLVVDDVLEVNAG
jgi:hypothetical protein